MHLPYQSPESSKCRCQFPSNLPDCATGKGRQPQSGKRRGMFDQPEMNLPIPLWRARFQALSKRRPECLIMRLIHLFARHIHSVISLLSFAFYFISFIHSFCAKKASRHVPGHPWAFLAPSMKAPGWSARKLQSQGCLGSFQQLNYLTVGPKKNRNRVEKMLIDCSTNPYICLPPLMRTIGQYRAARPQYTTAWWSGFIFSMFFGQSMLKTFLCVCVRVPRAEVASCMIRCCRNAWLNNIVELYWHVILRDLALTWQLPRSIAKQAA